MTAKEVTEDRWHLSDVVLPMPRPGAPVPESGGRLSMEVSWHGRFKDVEVLC